MPEPPSTRTPTASRRISISRDGGHRNNTERAAVFRPRLAFVGVSRYSLWMPRRRVKPVPTPAGMRGGEVKWKGVDLVERQRILSKRDVMLQIVHGEVERYLNESNLVFTDDDNAEGCRRRISPVVADDRRLLRASRVILRARPRL